MKKQKVVISIPSHSGTLNSECVLSILATQHLLYMKGIKVEVNILNGCPYLPVARNTLVAMFMKDKDATDLFFIDADVGFDASLTAANIPAANSTIETVPTIQNWVGGNGIYNE